MAGRQGKVAGLLKRFQFIDLAKAVAIRSDARKMFLTKYVDQKGRLPSYEPFRKAISSIYGVTLGLDPSPPPTWSEISDAICRSCRGTDEDMNLEVAEALHSFLGTARFQAYEVRERSLLIGPDRTVAFRMAHYIVRDGKAVFQFPFPRRARRSDREIQVMLALISHAYATGDFADAEVELADLSSPATGHPRQPRIVRLDRTTMPSLEALQTEIQDVYRVLMEISEEPE